MNAKICFRNYINKNCVGIQVILSTVCREVWSPLFGIPSPFENMLIPPDKKCLTQHAKLFQWLNIYIYSVDMCIYIDICKQTFYF